MFVEPACSSGLVTSITAFMVDWSQFKYCEHSIQSRLSTMVEPNISTGLLIVEPHPQYFLGLPVSGKQLNGPGTGSKKIYSK